MAGDGKGNGGGEEREGDEGIFQMVTKREGEGGDDEEDKDEDECVESVSDWMESREGERGVIGDEAGGLIEEDDDDEEDDDEEDDGDENAQR